MRVLPKWIGNWPVLLAITLTSILTMAGCGGSSSSSSGGNVTATPTFNPSAGTYNKSQTVTISDTTAGAVLYCTTDGTTPTTSSPACSQPTTVFKTEFLQAIAVVPGKSPSTVASAGYTIDLNAAATPVFSPAGGTYTSAQNVTIADATTGANIYYTADGSVPTANPVISSDGGPIGSDQTITITDASPNAAIYYTTDNSVPSATPGATHGTLYTAAFSISGAGTVKAVAGGTGLTSSAVVQSAFTIAAAAAAPAFTPNGGPVGSDQTVTITSTSGASIYYTTDPNVTPSVTPGATAGTLYTTPIPITGTETIKAGRGRHWLQPQQCRARILHGCCSGGNTDIHPRWWPGGFRSDGHDYLVHRRVDLLHHRPQRDAERHAGSYSGNAVYYADRYYHRGDHQGHRGRRRLQPQQPEFGQLHHPASGPSITGTVVNGAGASVVPLKAQVQLWAAGTSAYGPVADPVPTPLGNPVSTDPNNGGSFTLFYDCSNAAAPGDQLYLVATGSDDNRVTLMTVLGSCASPLATSVTINEATTVASAYALQQFMAADGAIGANSDSNNTFGAASAALSYQGLSYAFKAVNNLVDLSAGKVRTYTPDYPTNLTGDLTTNGNILNNSTVPTARINTLADVLASCVDANSNCSALTSATGSSSNTLTAALYIAQHPGTWSGQTTSGLYSLVADAGTQFTAPYTPMLSAEPNDWTLALTFTGGGLGFAPGGSAVYFRG